MTPPQLSGHTPITDVLQPPVPGRLMHLGNNLQVTVTNGSDGARSHRGAIHIPDSDRDRDSEVMVTESVIESVTVMR